MAMNGIGTTVCGTAGYQVPQPPKSDAQCAAERWSTARDALAEALHRSNEASARLQAAQQEEQAAWNSMEETAGRGSSKCADTGPRR